MLPAQAMADNAELAKRNTRLIEESEALLMRCQATGDAQQQPSSPAVKKNKKGLFPFRRCVLLTVQASRASPYAEAQQLGMSMPS